MEVLVLDGGLGPRRISGTWIEVYALGWRSGSFDGRWVLGWKSKPKMEV